MKIYPHVTFLFLLIASLSSNRVVAQKKISEGAVTYTVSYELNATQLLYADQYPKEITCYFRGDSSAATTNQGAIIVKGVSVFKANYHSLIIDIPSLSKKILVVMTPEEVEQEKEANPQFTSTKGTEKEVIDGYNCTKVTVTDTKSGGSYEVWITGDIDVPPNSVSKLVSDFGGVPVRFVTFNRGTKINAEIKEIKEVTVPAGFFSAAKDYQLMSFTELKAMAAGGK
jgi:hypothetical protein